MEVGELSMEVTNPQYVVRNYYWGIAFRRSLTLVFPSLVYAKLKRVFDYI